ncbi:DUF1508 domain-containing protein [Flavobacterium sp. MAH-1]|uniref:DUF1508 domain-containing protein n=1 Tax=Flavobacterium agri TaxID=2743471 RepID=A0A7Y9C4P6_9FLAO|nr:DUF1508 domain-containing protein [Flavobacterium agri]NUY79534.1 DUF1508 domain-containing protein [Flavobacterium agri]NYA69559.1 DUF1508 domain-containing protein [Flavobacterium agri]
MGTFVISKRFNGDYKFIFASRKGKTIFTSIGCKNKSDCELMIDGIRNHIDMFTFTKVRNAGGKYFFRLSKGGLVLANSRKYTTELLLKKGIDEILKYSSVGEVLDFSDAEAIFPEEEEIEIESL